MRQFLYTVINRQQATIASTLRISIDNKPDNPDPGCVIKLPLQEHILHNLFQLSKEPLPLLKPLQQAEVHNSAIIASKALDD